MKMNRSLRVVVYLVAVTAAVWAAEWSEDDTAVSTPVPAQPGLVAHIDPATGELLETAPADIVYEAPKTEQVFLEEASPGGGVMVQLNGAFQHAAVAKIQEDGEIQAECRVTDHAADQHDESCRTEEGGQ